MKRSLLSILPLFALAAVACATESGEENTGSDDAAVLDRGTARGIQTIHFASTTAGSPDETCVIPKHAAGLDYAKGDADDEKSLCSYSFYGTGPKEAGAAKEDVAICPKLSSTNPGVDIHELLPGKSREDTEAAICKLADRPTKHLAKFKQSITCSYAPSIIGYYHLSRALGGAGDVKAAVIRTMDLGEHKKITAEALQILAGQADSSYPKVSWLQYKSSESTPAASRVKDGIFTNDLLQIYGGLQVNARGEEKYSEINKNAGGTDPSSIFRRTPQYQNVIDARPLASMVKRDLASAAQTVVVMKDISEMLTLDYLMSQQDRFGNIHDIEYYYYPDTDGSTAKVKKSDVDSGDKPKPAGAVLVKKMIMKDNDCGGPAKTNVVKNAGMIDQIRHMSPKLYSNIQWLAGNFGSGQPLPGFFASEALFSQTDINMLRTNLGAMAPKLHDACKAGKLLLDLDLDAHLAGKNADPASCDQADAPGN